MRQFALPQRHEELLNKAFGPKNWHEDKQLTGFSGASIYQITYKNNPVVVKIAHPAVIQRERDGFHEFVLDNLRHHAPQLGDYHESDDHQEALLRYTYAGNSVARSQTLFEFLIKSTQKNVSEVCIILGKMFTVEQDDHPKSWWERAERKSIRCAEYYDRWLPVQVEVEQLPAPVAGAKVLQAGQISLPEITELTAGDFVQLQGFRVEKSEGTVVTLYTGRPQAPSLRVKVRGVQGTHEGEFPAFYAVVKETRKMLLEKYAEDAVGAFAMRSARFTVDGRDYENPFYYLDELLSTRHHAYIATIHGDFNLRNILLEEKTPVAADGVSRLMNRLLNRKTYDWWLIDFASAQTGPVLLDLQWLEAQVINWLLVPALQRAGQEPHALVHVLEGLHHRRALYFQLRTAELRAVYTLLLEIRRLAENYLAEPPHNPDRWQEYYRGLTLALAATLKHESLSNELGGQAKKFALVAAAKTVRWARERHKKPLPTWLTLGAPVAAALILALIYFGTTWLTGEEAPATTTPPPPPIAQPAISTIITPTLTAERPSILARVRDRGHLLCGVNGDLPLFGWDPVTPKHRSWKAETPEAIDAYDNAEGFDADFCRVVATAIFGDYVGRVKFVNVGAKERFQALTQQVIDVLSRNTTWTPDRDSGLGVDFAAINFYTRQKLLVKKGTFAHWQELAEQRICVLPATTTLANLVRLSPTMQWVTVTGDRQGSFDNNQQVFDAFKAGYCAAFTSDGDQLIAFSSQPKSGEERLYLPPGDYDILDIEDEAIPNEPRALVVPANDSHWRKVVSYAVWATIYAEELGITQRNVASYRQSPDLRFKEFLGVADALIPVDGQIGELLQLPPSFAGDIIAKVGNYGEIYARHLQAQIPQRGANQSSKLNPAGQLFTPPFTLAQLVMPTPAPRQAVITEQTAGPTRIPITIGVAIDLDGSELLLGEDQKEAALLAGNLFSRTIPGVQITVTIVNAGNTVAKADAAMHKLINEHQVVAISGPTLSSQALKVDQIPNAAGVPLIAPSNTVPGIPDLGCYVARISPPVTQLDPLALLAATKKVPRGGTVVVAYRSDNEFTIAEAQVFTETLATKRSDYHFELKATTAYTKEANFAEQATRILSHQPDLIMIAGLPKDGGTLVFELRKRQYTGYIIGGNGFNTSRVFVVCEECSKILLAQAFDSRVESQFSQEYQQRYGKRPSPIAAQMFSALQVLIESLADLNQRSPITGTTPLSNLRDGINQRLLSGKPFTNTPLGAIAFAPNGEILQEQFYLAETQSDSAGQWYFETFDGWANKALDALRTTPTDCPAGYLP
ncbi:MAG: ABC transporter substrate-binding protein [Caldilineaceae bacterium]